jgi:hypothetical protein
MKYYLTHGSDSTLSGPQKEKDLRLKSAQYQLIQGILCRKNYDGVFLRCLEKRDVEKVLSELHDGPAGGHYGGDTTAQKILREGYYWPSLFKYAHAYARKFQQCQTSVEEKIKLLSPYNLSSSNSPSNSGGWTLSGRSIQTHRSCINTS